MAGLPALRRDWIMARGDVEEYQGRAIRPEANGLTGPDRARGVEPFPNVVQRPLRARPGMTVSQMPYARRGINTPAMESLALRDHMGGAQDGERVVEGKRVYGLVRHVGWRTTKKKQ